jgi:hypothetical protein
MTPDSKDLPGQTHPKYLAGFIAQFGILKVGDKEEKPRNFKTEKGRLIAAFSLWTGADQASRNKPTYVLSNPIRGRNPSRIT